MAFNPVDLITVAHRAFRRDLANIDAAALGAARDGHDASDVIERIGFFSEMLSWHANGEDAGIFPALEPVAPSVATAYELDHRGLDLAAEGLARAVEDRDPLAVARATAAFKFHLDMHLYKEDVHLYVLFAERLPTSAQTDAVGVFTEALPAERFGDFVAWLFPLVSTEDRGRVVRVWQAAMPPEVFAGSMRLVRRTIGDDYGELVQAVPDLASL